MPRKYKYKDVYLDRRIESLVQELMPNPKIQRLLILHNFDNNVQGVTKLAVILLVEHLDKILDQYKLPDSRDAARPKAPTPGHSIENHP